ncbi:MAG: formate dehydrogenase accessory sulfurtransferase FdhD [Bacteroidota bacterium]
MKEQQSRSIYRFGGQGWRDTTDSITTEEPLEIKIGFGKGKQRQQRSLSVTMRTPGDDFNLARGFLFTEGLIQQASDIVQMRYTGTQLDKTAQGNILLVDLHPDLNFDIEQVQRHFYASSSCGICGKASIDLIHTMSCFNIPSTDEQWQPQLLLSLPKQLRRAQTIFAQTGGIHAVGLFDNSGQLQTTSEDVGRHNAMDKLIGRALQSGQIPLSQSMILVSGRASFELTQKATMAGVRLLAAVGAPSTLAIDLATEYGMALVGFLKNGRFNVYSGIEQFEQ